MEGSMVVKAGEPPAIQRKAGEMAVVERKAGEPPALQVGAADFLKQNTPVKVMRECLDIKTPLEAARATDKPTLGAIRKAYGENFVFGYLKLWIINLTEYLGASPMSDIQLEETAILLTSDYYNLNVADLNVLMTSIKRGERTLNSPITGVKLSKLFSDYFTERCNACAESHYNEHEVLKRHGYVPCVNDIAQATLDAMIENQLEAARIQAEAEQERIDRQYHALRNKRKVEGYLEKMREERGKIKD